MKVKHSEYQRLESEQATSSNPDNKPLFQKIKGGVYWFVDKTKKPRDAVDEGIGKFLAVGWPAFAASFLYMTMAAAKPGLITPAGLIWAGASFICGILGVIANIGLLKYNERRQKVAKLLKSNKKDELDIVKMKDNIYEYSELLVTLNKKITAIEKRNNQKITDSTENLRSVEAARLETVSFNKITKLIGQLVEDKDHLKGQIEKIQTAEDNSIKTKGWRNLAFAFQILAHTCGSAGLPFFIFLSLNALSLTFLTSVLLISIVVTGSALWGLYKGITLAKEIDEDGQTHKANLLTLKAELESVEKCVKTLYARLDDTSRLMENAVKTTEFTKDQGSIIVEHPKYNKPLSFAEMRKQNEQRKKEKEERDEVNF